MAGVTQALLFGHAGIGGIDSFTKLLARATGADGATTFVDRSAAARTLTANGNAQVDTAITKFGPAILLDGTGDFVSAADSADFTLGTGEWTIETWFNRSGGDGNVRRICGQCDSGGTAASASFLFGLQSTNVGLLQVSNGAGYTTVTGTTTFTATGWHHLAAVRTGNILRLFVNGVQEGGDVAFAGTVPNSTNTFSIGRIGEFDGQYWQGSLDEVRLSVGIARWTANFTPPAVPYS
jgi:hypothetical protein